MTITDLDTQKMRARDWFRALQEDICSRFEAIELAAEPPLYRGDPGKFDLTEWKRGDGTEDLGGGRMGLMRGKVFEKVGVHFSEVHGTFSEGFAAQIPGADQSDGRFWASGLSLIAHPRNPHVPAAHMNTRMLVTSQSWFGGGGDLNPLLAYQRDQAFEDSVEFHAAMKAACDIHPGADYAQMKETCDTYFNLPHRDEPRGTGGIFYDRFNSGDWDADFAFTREVGKQFADIYPDLVRKRFQHAWNEAEREEQLIQRGRYVEFNLLYDRGTTFGLKTGGNVTSILSSMPPVVKWP
ncbi:coproporphyrinogen III oxidase [Hyphomonas adhaerens MHS-3]|uniref:coproporphyrinogen oxidase n=1 Tax=Hyphomonas adhaerens MHS-3 TaxID=1280949 RepID=A0A069E5W4_9PROT|nr:oxygen-dependent coproporphyrinogen oxidase [Hyphomonas adhaerens]KCZ85369.1 coproporphyrinogen III oxidase [Hyphomonas adhaerens MHS-3]